MRVNDQWLTISRHDLHAEHAQAADEGVDLAPFQAEFHALDRDEVRTNPALQARAGELLDAIQRAPIREDYPYHEPSDLPGIRAAAAPADLPGELPAGQALRDKVYGAWLGRASGCLLGKPVEGRRREQIETLLKHQGRWPLTDYFSIAGDATVREECGVADRNPATFVENITRMVEDDDTNYTTLGLALMDEKGPGFQPVDVAEFWLRHLPLYHVCTAERIAYRNLVNLLPVPDGQGAVDGEFSSATCRNVYREWIGAQIRADYFGYVCAGDPTRAAELAWRDAAISHVKNGIYGEMWAAAMIAAAFVTDDPAMAIRAGLAQIPERCRLAEDLRQVLAWREEGRDYGAVVDALHARWDESFQHHWCHTNSNAQVVAIALLWGERDFTRTLGYAVMPGFDTDCNGATAGSVVGAMLGAPALPDHWTAPLNDTMETGVHGYTEVKLSAMARRTVEMIRSLRS